MTSEIEAKRKELEDEIKILRHDVDAFTIKDLYEKHLEGFNLACEMKDKEFLHFLESINNLNIIEKVNDKIIIIKQSLGGKGK